MRRQRARLTIALAAWLLIAALAWSWSARHGDGVLGGVAAVLRAVDGHPATALALVAAFVLRPFTLLPVTVLSAFTGFLLGPVVGFVVALVAVVTTSLIPYALTRAAKRGAGDGGDRAQGAGGWRGALRTRPFEAVLIARLAMLPGDLVSVASGVLRVPPLVFVTATAIGGSPGMLIGVLAGASIQGAFRIEAARVDVAMVMASATILVVSLALSGYLRRRGAPGGAT